LRYYRKAFMAPAPGPDEAAAKAISADIVSTSILNK
ncbi:oligoribonuclease, partial [Bifidobacterium breve]